MASRWKQSFPANALVAPLFDGEGARTIVIPRGEWCDFWTGEAVGGGKTVEVAAGYGRIPVYVKAGSVLAMGGVGGSTADAATRVLTVRVFGDGLCRLRLGRRFG